MEKERKNTLWAYSVLAGLIIISLLYIASNEYYVYLVTYIWFGVAYGMMLQYGRFCFASATRDLFATGVPRMAVGIIIALVFFGIVQAGLKTFNMSTFHPAPAGIHTLIAGIIFGVGMTMAGGCASGSLYKIGEGNGTSMLAILGISFGQAIFVTMNGVFTKLVPTSWKTSALAKGTIPEEKLRSWFDYYIMGYIFDKKAIQLSDLKAFQALKGWERYFISDALLNVIIPSIIIVVTIYYFYTRKSFIRKRQKAGEPSTGLKTHITGIWEMLTASKRTALMGVLIGITAGLHIFVIKGMQNKFVITNFGQLLTRMGHTGDVGYQGTVFDPGYWYITTQEAQFAGWVLQKIGINMKDNVFFGVINGLPEIWRNPALWMSIGIIAGAMVLALFNKEFKFKLPSGELILWGLLGGTLMGIGSRPALGCNIGAFFIRVAGGDPGGWLFGGGMAIGAFIAVKFFNWWTERKMAKEMAAFDIEL